MVRAAHAHRLTLIFTNGVSGSWFARQAVVDDKDHITHHRRALYALYVFIFIVIRVARALACMFTRHPRRVRTRYLRRTRSAHAFVHMRASVFRGAHGERREERRGA